MSQHHLEEGNGECKHEDVKLVNVLENIHLCAECKRGLVSNEIEILSQFYEIGAFCDNKFCGRYLILVA